MSLSSGKEHLLREALEDFVARTLEYPLEGFLDQRNKLGAEQVEVLVDGFVDDFTCRIRK